MVNPRAVRENLNEWLQNPTWKEYYDEAPSQLCREYISLDFYASETEDEEAFKKMDRIIQDLRKEDLQYLYANAEGPEKKQYAELIKRM